MAAQGNCYFLFGAFDCNHCNRTECVVDWDEKNLSYVKECITFPAASFAFFLASSILFPFAKQTPIRLSPFTSGLPNNRS